MVFSTVPAPRSSSSPISKGHGVLSVANTGESAQGQKGREGKLLGRAIKSSAKFPTAPWKPKRADPDLPAKEVALRRKPWLRHPTIHLRTQTSCSPTVRFSDLELSSQARWCSHSSSFRTGRAKHVLQSGMRRTLMKRR
jgi:hypothetical protein